MSYIKNHAEYCGYLLGQEKRATTANPPVWSCVMVQLVGCFTFLNNTKKIYDIVHHTKAISKSLDYYITFEPKRWRALLKISLPSKHNFTINV